jgi:hypothetical protein
MDANAADNPRSPETCWSSLRPTDTELHLHGEAEFVLALLSRCGIPRDDALVAVNSRSEQVDAWIEEHGADALAASAGLDEDFEMETLRLILGARLEGVPRGLITLSLRFCKDCARRGGLEQHLTTREQQLEGKAAVVVQPRSGPTRTAFEAPVERLLACARSGGKTAYPDQLTALRELREMQWRNVPLRRAYQCDHCGFWHLTKREQWKE